MNCAGLMLFAAVTCGKLSLLNLSDSHPLLVGDAGALHDTAPWFYRQHVDLVIDAQSQWRHLLRGDCKTAAGNTVLVELKDFCFLPSAADAALIRTEFVLFGPYYDWHHVNFGPFSELGAPAGANFLEARLTNKLARCSRSLADVHRLLELPALRWWIVHQHVHAAVRHAKLRVMPLGFGYQGKHSGDDSHATIASWKQMALDKLRKRGATASRSRLLLTSFQIHVNLFGNEGNDPRSELLRNLSAIDSLRQYATVERFGSSDAFADAVIDTKFVLSPWGWGPDCFRHYEAVALGAVPVVLADWTLDRALERLPHVRVERWSELSAAMLERAYERIDADVELERLLRTYWLRRLFFVPSDARRVCNQFGQR